MRLNVNNIKPKRRSIPHINVWFTNNKLYTIGMVFLKSIKVSLSNKIRLISNLGIKKKVNPIGAYKSIIKLNLF
jgi:hypothetical protein